MPRLFNALTMLIKSFHRKEHYFSLIAGALITLSLAPFHLWPLGIIAAALLALSLHHASPSQAAWRGWLFGLSLFGSGTSWVYVSIHVYGAAPIPLAVTLTLLFSMGLALFTAFTWWLYRRLLPDTVLNQSLGFASVWVLGEWLRSWLLTGFPWLFLGHSHNDSPLTGLAPIGGVLAISFIVALTGATLVQIVQQRQWRNLLLIIGVWIGSAFLHNIQWSHPSYSPIKVALVQPATPQQLKWNSGYYQTTLNTLTRLSSPLWAEHDIVIWPEAAIPTYLDNAQDFIDAVSTHAQKHQASLITGIPSRTAPNELSPYSTSYNSVIAVGNGSGLYHKQNLVPFGEYVPLQFWLRGIIDFFNLPMSNFARGPKDQPPLTVSINNDSLTLAPFLCYEIVYGDLVAQSRADILITLSNDTWFGQSIGPHQHLQIAQMRAIENQRELIRATNSGITVLTDEKGQIKNTIPQFSTGVLSGHVQPRHGLTPYAIVGSWPIIVLSGIFVLFGCAKKRTIKR